MYALIRQYKINPIFEADFIHDWKKLAEAYHTYSEFIEVRFHRELPIGFISYECWRSREDFERIMNDDNGVIRPLVDGVHRHCNRVNLLYHMDLIDLKDWVH